MNTSGTEIVEIDRVYVADRLRAVDDDYATLIAGSFADLGQLTPIEVRPQAPGWFELVAGAHRLAAAKLLGWTQIQAAVRESSDLEAELRQIDENLVRRDLNPFDRATFMARRQDVYVALHPDTAQGKAGASTRWNATAKLSFASDMAARTGVSERDIRRSVARYRSIAPDVREKIAGTWIANHGVSLDALAKLGMSDQRKVIGPMLRADKPIKSVAKAFAEVTGRKDVSPDVDSEQLAKLMDAWRRSSGKARREFLGWLASIDALPAKGGVALRAFDLTDEEAA